MCEVVALEIEEHWYGEFIVDSYGVITFTLHYVKVLGQWFDYTNGKLEAL
jgi:hypothetical protein